jgi:hypothetical protein
LAHIDGDLIDHTLGDLELQIENTGTGFDFELGFRGDFGIMYELGDTSDPVATHFRFASIGIEHAHFGIGDGGREDQDDSITTDSEASVGQFNGQPLEIFGQGLREALDVDVVVTGAVHFREREFHHVNPLFDLWESESHCGGHYAKFLQRFLDELKKRALPQNLWVKKGAKSSNAKRTVQYAFG